MEDRFIENYKTGFPFLEIVASATPDRGIVVLNEDEQKDAIEKYENFEGSIVKFVPASGAASRMFKDLFEARERLASGQSLEEGSAADRFISNIEKYPFYSKEDFEGLSPLEILDYVIGRGRSAKGREGLDYGNHAKGEILFHKYSDKKKYSEVRTAIEEHLVEGALYARQKDGVVNIHFTVSPQHQDGFRNILNSVLTKYEKRYLCKYEISFSIQDPETDIIAVNEDNTPFLKEDGMPLYRPGGHGALLKNLNGIYSDIIFLKNIDNVVNQKYLDETVRWKKILGGRLLEIKEKVFTYLEDLDRVIIEKKPNPGLIAEIKYFLRDTFCIELPGLPSDLEAKYLHAKLDRPIRVCGMVRNEGEPGGGPYIVYDADHSTSLQILESAQLDRNNPEVLRMVENSTHFNPVDIVCSTKNYLGRKFSLARFVDPSTGFISEKSYQGRKLKAQELPGLWNGSMSNWNTVFVETPLITFNPVKTVLDLLRKEHCTE